MERDYISADTRQRIQDLIKQNKDMTQAKLARELDISERTLSRFLSGETGKLGYNHIIKIAKIFDVSTDFLLGETNIPDRKNYDIEELGLTAEAAKALYTGKVNTRILNQLLENPKFAALTSLLEKHQQEVFMTGMAAMNENLNFMRSLLINQANVIPADRASSLKAADDVQNMKIPPISIDTTALQNLFLGIVKDLRDNAESHLEESRMATKETLEQFRRNLTKDDSQFDLKSATPEQTSAAILQMIPEGTFSDDLIQGLDNSLTAIFEAAKGMRNE